MNADEEENDKEARNPGKDDGRKAGEKELSKGKAMVTETMTANSRKELILKIISLPTLLLFLDSGWLSPFQAVGHGTASFPSLS